jgi:hypothetical protein
MHMSRLTGAARATANSAMNARRVEQRASIAKFCDDQRRRGRRRRRSVGSCGNFGQRSLALYLFPLRRIHFRRFAFIKPVPERNWKYDLPSLPRSFYPGPFTQSANRVLPAFTSLSTHLIHGGRPPSISRAQDAPRSPEMTTCDVHFCWMYLPFGALPSLV